MSTWLVLPVKSIADGKSRLAPHLEPNARRALNVQLLERSLRLASNFVGPERTLVVSRCKEVLARAGARGVVCLPEQHPGLNEALSQAAHFLRGRNASRIIVLSCDLPLASVADLHALADNDGVALATDRAGCGTNALSLPDSAFFQFRYGVSSRQLHAEEAARHGLCCRVLERPGLAFDLDTLKDLHEWREMCAA